MLISLIKKLKWRSLIFAKTLYGEISNRNNDEDALLLFPIDSEGNKLLSSPNGFYAEVGFGIENIFKIIRVDYLRRLTNNPIVETADWAIKIGIEPKF